MKNLCSIISFLCLVVLFAGCDRKPIDDTNELSSEKKIISFFFSPGVNISLKYKAAGVIDESAKTIQVVLPNDISVKSLTPTFVISKNADILSTSTGARDFTSPVKYVIIAEDKTTAEYTVTVTQKPLPEFKSLKINGIPVMREGHTFYYPVRIDKKNETKNKIEFEAVNINEIYINNVASGSSGSDFNFTSFESNDTFTLKAGNNDFGFEEYKLVLTGVPIVDIQVNGAIPDEPKAPCTISVTDPMGRINGDKLYISERGGIETRGAYSQRFDKKSYSIEFRDDTDAEIDVSMLGLRADGDWILDAMYVDHSRMRNRLCTDIWNTMNKPYHFDSEPEAVNGTRGFYVEVFINNQYRGLYCLTERIDRKQLKVKKDVNTGGVIYKGDVFTNTTLFKFIEGAYDNNLLTWKGFEAEHPAEVGNARWNVLYDMIKFASPVENPDDQNFADDFNKHFDMGNIVDYLIFVNATCAHDNFGKNIYWSVYNTKKDVRFFCTPWDLDGSFGRNSNSVIMEGRGFLGFGLNNIAYNETALYQRMNKVNPDNFKEKLKARWTQLKDNELSNASIAAMINGYKDVFVKSGAYKRELARWPERCTAIETEAPYMISWYGNHREFLNSFFDNILDTMD